MGSSSQRHDVRGDGRIDGDAGIGFAAAHLDDPGDDHHEDDVQQGDGVEPFEVDIQIALR
jgi:hypothetical protein